MKNTILKILTSGLSISILCLTGCGADPEITAFKNDLNTFCENIAQIDQSINSIDVTADNATVLALGYLDKADQEFKNFAELDFPEDYDYLEPLADEASAYMTEAVKSYHIIYSENGYDADMAAYAKENSARAAKRVQVILDVLQGEYEQSSSHTDVSGS